jgi:altronate dehydratase
MGVVLAPAPTGLEPMKPNILIINPRDNVAVALDGLVAGQTAVAEGGGSLTALSDIPASHKIALGDIAAGGEIVKYGETIAVAMRDIKKGEWVHTHNLESRRWKR